MKTIASRNAGNKRRNIIILAACVLLVLSMSAFLLVKDQQRRSQEELETQQPSQSAKNDILNSDKSSTTPSEGLPEDPTSLTTDQVPTSSELSVDITSTSQSDGNVRASAKTSGSGTCVFLYQPGDNGKPVTRQVPVNVTSCSVEISQNEFSYLGAWKLTTTYYSNNNKAEDSVDVTIR